MKIKVWKWQHNWTEDSGTYLYASEAAAKLAIHQYVHEQWNEGLMDDEEFTGNTDADIQKYFERHDEQEWYSLTSETVEFLNVPNVPDAEIVLSSNECAVIVAALSYSGYGEISREMEVPMELEDIRECVDSAYDKLKD